MAAATGTPSSTERGGEWREEGSGWVLFAGIMIVTVGILNLIYGIAAIGDSSFFVADQKFILSGLNTWGWVMLILGVGQILAAFSIWAGNSFGRWFGIACAMLNAIAAAARDPGVSVLVTRRDRDRHPRDLRARRVRRRQGARAPLKRTERAEQPASPAGCSPLTTPGDAVSRGR